MRKYGNPRKSLYFVKRCKYVSNTELSKMIWIFLSTFFDNLNFWRPYWCPIFDDLTLCLFTKYNISNTYNQFCIFCLKTWKPILFVNAILKLGTHIFFELQAVAFKEIELENSTSANYPNTLFYVFQPPIVVNNWFFFSSFKVCELLQVGNLHLVLYS